MRKILILIMICCLGLLLNGCTSSIYYHTEIDPSHNIAQEDNFIVFLPKEPTIEDKKIKKMLENSLARNGYIVNPNIKAGYGIFFQAIEKTYSRTQNTTDTVPVSEYSTSYVKGVPVVTSTTKNQVVARSYTVSNTYKKIKVDIVINNSNKFETVWTGFTSSEIDTYEKNPPAVIDQLVKLIGKDFKDDIYVEMDPSENPK